MDDLTWLNEIPASKRSRAEVHRLIDLSKQHINKPGENKADLDKAWELASQAKRLSHYLHYEAGYQETLQAMCMTQVERGNSRAAWQLIEQAQDSTKVEMLLAMQGYYFFGGQLTKSLDSSIICLEKASMIAKSQGYAPLEFNVRSFLAARYIMARNLSEFTEHNSRSFQLQKSVSQKALLDHYVRTAQSFYQVGMYKDALDYALSGLRLSEENTHLKADFGAGSLYNLLGIIYYREKQYDKAVEVHKRAWEIFKAGGDTQRTWLVCESLVIDYVRMVEPAKALQIIERTEKEIGFANVRDEVDYLRILGNYYQRTGQVTLTGQTNDRLVDLVEKNGIVDQHIYNLIGNFYIQSKEFIKARHYLVKAMELPQTPPQFRASIHRTLYTLDSTTGNYLSAIQHLRKGQQLDDSMKSLDKEKQIQDLLVQYESEKKDRDLRLKEQSFTLLARQSELRQKDLDQARLELAYETQAKQQQLQLASMEAKAKDRSILLHRNSLQQAKTTRNLTIAGAVLLLIILLLVVNSYRLKKAASLELNKKNSKLESLVNEKELLLREVHHRVKNNLQMVVSLLELQADDLSSDALVAIQASQNRIYATSLLHQKLYQDDTISSVNMRSYLPELVGYLKQAFNLRNEIEFVTDIDNVDLDVSQAVPIGLIVNETITNSIKYAFRGSYEHARISVSLKIYENETAVLDIVDNGIGLPDCNESRTTGLGLTLVKGLAGDIDGEPSIESVNGTKISIRFKAMSPLSAINNQLKRSNFNHTATQFS
ncbi:hypothetical protein OI18_21860 [Flavihumibacter solisilvae]|uniref:histidine kinase n=1 Tax=Flavihumibacter solisilvae TaxID=1349421 RepID=A0A0C1IQ88_9BACT|nr:hypothetical protein OI18_21860 [Flavihumibacter solisilvae]